MSEFLSWLQALATPFIAATFVIYIYQLNAMRRGAAAQNGLAVINLLRDPAVREARHVVFTQLEKKPFSDWTADDKRAAHLVCTNYDIAGMLIRNGLAPKNLIVHNWAASIIKAYAILRPFIAELCRTGPNKMYGDNLGWLKDEAKSSGVADGV